MSHFDSMSKEEHKTEEKGGKPKLSQWLLANIEKCRRHRGNIAVQERENSCVDGAVLKEKNFQFEFVW